MLPNENKEELKKIIEEKVNKIVDGIIKDSGKDLSDDEIQSLKNHLTSLMLVDEKFRKVIELENVKDIENIIFNINNSSVYKENKIKRILKQLKFGLMDFVLISLLLATSVVWIPGFSITPHYIVFSIAIILIFIDRIIKKHFLKYIMPLVIYSFGIFYFVAHSIVLYLLSIFFGDMFVVDSFYSAFIASIIINVFKFLFEIFLLKKPMKYKFIIKL